MDTLPKCPHCDDYHDYQAEDGQVYTGIIGVEVMGEYDGILYYCCPVTYQAFPRQFKQDDLNRQSAKAVERHNNRLKEARHD